MKHFLILFVLAAMSLGNTGSVQAEFKPGIIATIKSSDSTPNDYNILIKTSEEMYKTSQELLEHVKNLP